MAIVSWQILVALSLAVTWTKNRHAGQEHIFFSREKWVHVSTHALFSSQNATACGWSWSSDKTSLADVSPGYGESNDFVAKCFGRRGSYHTPSWCSRQGHSRVGLPEPLAAVDRKGYDTNYIGWKFGGKQRRDSFGHVYSEVRNCAMLLGSILFCFVIVWTWWPFLPGRHNKSDGRTLQMSNWFQHLGNWQMEGWSQNMDKPSTQFSPDHGLGHVERVFGCRAPNAGALVRNRCGELAHAAVGSYQRSGASSKTAAVNPPVVRWGYASITKTLVGVVMQMLMANQSLPLISWILSRKLRNHLFMFKGFGQA